MTGKERKTGGKVGRRRRIPAAFLRLLVCLSLLAVWGGCAGKSPQPTPPPEAYPEAKVGTRIPPRPPLKKLANLGYTIQAGAFSKVENAARLTDKLRLQGLDAYYFVHSSGLFKVRFGNFRARASARARAETLRRDGIIEEYYIVSPEEYAVARRRQRGDAYLRAQLVKTAGEFIGVPYLWGGTTRENGMDCSGLVMAVYQLNGLALPRTSREQYEAGFPVERDRMEKGDLLFFAKGNDAPISHVGIYIGDGRFIHAPATGKKIRIESLSRPYYARRYVGSRTYL